MRVEHEYDRGGALTYLAADDVHRAVLHGRCAACTGIEPLMALVEQVMSQEPYRSATRVFWIVDNGSSHLDQIEQRLAAFERRYNANARPFTWRFTTADLNDLLARIERHENDQTPATP